MQMKKTSAIALLLIALFAISIVAIPAAIAHDPPWIFPTVAHVVPTVNPVGVGQSLYIYMWIDKIKPGAAIGNDVRMHNYNLTILKSDGTKVLEQIFPTVADTTSNQVYQWTPNAADNYTIIFTFPGDTYTSAEAAQVSGGNRAYENDTYLPSSATATLLVQEETIPFPPSSYPLPTEYWTRPIYGENTDWWSISSNWLGTGAAGYGGYTTSYNLGGNGAKFYPGDAVGPQTAHIMWTKPLQSGGVVGGDNFVDYRGNTWFEGSAYNQRFTNPIIVNGRLYYKEPESFLVSFFAGPTGPTKCVDLHTGEVIWSRDDVPLLSFAYIYDVENPNQHGVYPAILFTSNFGRAFDADTGNPLFNVTGVPSDSSGFARDKGLLGEQLRFVMSNAGNSTHPAWYLGQWNSSRLWDFTSGLSPSIPGSADGSTPNRYDWNVSIPWRNTMTTPITVVQAYYNDVMLCYNGTLPSSGSPFMGTFGYQPYTYFAVSLKPESRGQILWRQTYNPPPGNVTVLQVGVDPVNRVFVENYRETIQFVGYSLDNGTQLWGPSDPQAALDYYGSQASGSIATAFAYGKLYSSAYAGILYCYDTSNGEVVFTYGNGGVPGNDTNSGFGVPGPYPTFVNAIGNGIVYLVTSEHTIETPLYKGALTRAINATDGTEIWTLSSYVGEFFTTSFAIADGFATWFNGLDNRIYSVGRGPSATTVNAPGAGLAFGQPLVITGTVMDIAAGTKQTEQAGRFPNGVPAVSDANMGDWMGYVYQQKPFPANCTGVPVSINVWDSNNNYRNIGTAISDANGFFSFEWTPDIPGKFNVIATFEGTNGYWPSMAESAFTVMAEPEATPTPTPMPQSAADMYFVPAVIGIIIAIVVVGAVIILMQRKRP